MKIQYKKENNIAVITMDDGKANAMDFEFFKQMNDALEKTEKDSAKALIIAGRPGFYSGGLDLKLIPTLPIEDFDAFVETFANTMLRVYAFPIPTIAACTGHAIAGGTILSFACDRIVAQNGPYKIQMNEMLTGLPIPAWMFLIARSAISSRLETEVLLHARIFSPQEALDRNMIDILVDEGDDILASASSLAKEFFSINQTAYAVTKKRMRDPEIKHVLDLLKDELPSKLLALLK